MPSNLLPKQTARKECKLLSTNNHPLASTVTSLEPEVEEEKNSNSKCNRKIVKENSIENNLVKTTWNGLDPLSAALTSNELLPNENEEMIPKHSKERDVYLEMDFVSWNFYRTKILNKFITAEKLSIKSFLVNPFLNQTILSKDIAKMEQLDEVETNSINEDLSQQEYTKRIEEKNIALKNAWENDERVTALKIAIQCAKQLSTINVIHFYPSKFVLITDILDNFGQLVQDRLERMKNNLQEDANDTCRNWFYKISSIRELLPRFYIECSIIKIYSLLIDSKILNEEYEKIFLRLTKMIRGLGDPLVALYCRVYLCRTVIKLFPENKKIFLLNIYDIIDNVNQLICDHVRKNLSTQKIDYPGYYSLFTPGINWIFNCLFYKNTIQETVLKYFQNKIESFHCASTSGFILNSIITNSPSNFIAQNVLNLFRIIKILYKNEYGTEKINSIAYPEYILLKSIGDSLVQEDDFFKKYSLDKNIFFEEYWNMMKNLNQKHEYVACLESWSEIIAKFSNVDDINKILGNIANNLLVQEYENFSTQLLNILSKIIVNGSKRINCETFFSMSNLLPFLDLFQKDAKIDACKIIITSFNKNCSPNFENETTNDAPDPVILNLMTYLCKLIHDSIDSLTLEDEKRQISTLIIGFIRRVSFQRDLEARLNFYIESRANYSNLDQVLSFIVHQVNCLGMETHKLVNGQHTKKTISFVNACIAFSYITIPSIYDIILRLQLYLSSSHVALINGCLPQTDSFLKLTITLLRQLPPHTESSDGKFYSNEEFLNSYLSQLLSTLIVVPDNPDLGILYLFKGLYNVLKEWKFEINSCHKVIIWMNMIKYLSTCIQDNYPYHIEGVDSNDTLYAQDDEFIKEIVTYYDIIFQEMLDIFKKSQQEFTIKQQCNLALEFINMIINFGNINQMSHVIHQLWNWTCKTKTKHNILGLEYKMKYIYSCIEETFKIHLKVAS